MSGQGSDDTLLSALPNRYPTVKDAEFAKSVHDEYGSGNEGLINPVHKGDKYKNYKGKTKTRKTGGETLVENYDTITAPKELLSYVWSDQTEINRDRQITHPKSVQSLLEQNISPENLSEVTPRLSEVIGQASLAVRRSALASLAFDPGNAMWIKDADYDGIAGLSIGSPKSDKGKSGQSRLMTTYRSNPNEKIDSLIVHETLHRSFTKLAQAFHSGEGYEKNRHRKGFDARGDLIGKVTGISGISEEDFIRWVMETKMGDPNRNLGFVPAEGAPRDTAKYAAAYKSLERQAAELIKKNRPSGHR